MVDIDQHAEDKARVEVMLEQALFKLQDSRRNAASEQAERQKVIQDLFPSTSLALDLPQAELQLCHAHFN